jgi:hypothetical protein
MYINEIHLEEMFSMENVEGFYEFYPKEEYQTHFKGIKNLYHEGKYVLLAKQLGVLFEPTLNYLVDFDKARSPLLNQLVKKETTDEVLAYLAVAMILDSYEDGSFIMYGDVEVIENLNYFEFHELDDRENVKAYFEFIELPDAGDNSFTITLIQMKTLWQWADKFNIPHDALPRDREGLLALTELEIVSQGLMTKLNDVSELAEVLEENDEVFYLPVELFELVNLTKLEIIGMSLTYLPEEIEKLENLTELILVINQLEIIPSSVGNLKNLTTLNLSINWLEEIPLTLMKLKNLKHLDVSSDQLTITSDQEYWLEELSDTGCEVIWDKDNTRIIEEDDEYDEEQGTRDLIEMLGGEEALTDALREL